MRVRIALAALVALASTAPLAASVAPRAVATQLGNVRQVVQGDRYIAWTRCLSPTGPTEVWAAPRARGKAFRVKGVRPQGPCDQVTLVGAYKNAVVAIVTPHSGLKRLDAIDVRTGRRTLLEAETLSASGYRVVAADVTGPRVVWVREVGAGEARVSETVVGDLRAPGDGTYGGAPRRVMYQRSLQWRAVVPTGVWVAHNGNVVVREAISGAAFGYGEASDRLTQIAPSGDRTLARLPDGFAVVDADLTPRHLAYTVQRTATGQVWMYVLDRRTGKRRLVRRVRVPATLPPYAPAVPAPRLDGTRLVWRERVRVRRGYVDRVLVRSLSTNKVRLVARVNDTRSQRAFVSAPAILGRRVAWAQAVLPTAEGPTGGYYGLSPAGAQSRLFTTLVR